MQHLLITTHTHNSADKTLIPVHNYQNWTNELCARLKSKMFPHFALHLFPSFTLQNIAHTKSQHKYYSSKMLSNIAAYE